MNTQEVLQKSGKDYSSNNFSEFRKRVDEGKLVALDCGKKGVVVYDGTETKNLNSKQVFDYILNKYYGWSLVCENAHLGVNRPKKPTSSSLAQYWYAEELLDFYARCEEANIILRLAPQQSTPTMEIFSGYDPKEDKSDEIDAMCLHKFITAHEKFCLRKPPSSFDETEVRKEGYRMKDAMNATINISKTNGYGAKDPDLVPEYAKIINNSVGGDDFKNLDMVIEKCKIGPNLIDLPARFIYHNLDEITSKLSTSAKEAFFQYDKKGKLSSFKVAQIYAILSSLMGEPYLDENDNVVINDNIRIRESQGEMAYWKFAKTHLFCFSPFHQKGGVAASNLKYHGQRHFVAKKSEEEEGVLFKTGPQKFVPKAKILLEGNGELFSKNRAAYMKAIQEVFNLFRDMLLERENKRKPTSIDQCSKSTSLSQ